MPEPAERFLNRELSWLEFNQRVLEEAQNTAAPLLERLKFLAITASNLDEFFMVRIGGLRQAVAEKSTERDPSGRAPDQQLAAATARIRKMLADQYACLADIEPKLAAAGLRRRTLNDIEPAAYDHLASIFSHDIHPVVTPIAVQPGEFPLLPGLTLNLAVRLKPAKDSTKPRYAVITLPKKLGRFITLPVIQGHNYVPVEDIAGEFVDQFFPGEEIAEWVPFRITRNAGMGVSEDSADFLADMKEILSERKQSPCIRLEISDRVSKTLLAFLQTALEIDDAGTFPVPGPLELSANFGIARMTGFDNLRDAVWPPQPAPGIGPNDSIFDIISKRDILLHHPYETFDPVVRLVEEAADDPSVLAIKQILYRTSENSPIVKALARAASRDKHVTVLVELKARFDEARNIGWAEALEQQGVQVIYGLRGYKTHAKICVIVRREATGIRRYVHFGTGNYNELTARLYGDISYITCREDYGADATAFFNTITGYSQPLPFRKIHAAPIGLRARVLDLIQSEIARREQGQEARIIAKMNALVDEKIVEALYKASQAGVKIQLNIRGICCLRPGVPDLSENITVTSVVDRYLEHARILYFHHGGDPLLFISSADWMPRNLDRRVELLVPVDDETSRAQLIAILHDGLRDNQQARRLNPDGTYTRLKPTGKEKPFRSQHHFYEQATAATQRAKKSAAITFEPRRPVHTP